jgi:hypothetical protein
MKIILLSIIFLSFNFEISAQLFSKEIKTREVIFNYPDSFINANILIGSKKIKVDNDLIYYWYFAHRLNINKGDFSGSVLHGEYLVYTNDNQLIGKGSFNKGLKDGQWKKWDSNGNLLSIINWEDGMRQGETFYFNKKNHLESEIPFKNDKISGTAYFYGTSDTLIRYYKNGIEYIPEKLKKANNPTDTAKTKKFWHIFHFKKDKDQAKVEKSAKEKNSEKSNDTNDKRRKRKAKRNSESTDEKPLKSDGSTKKE